MSLESQSGVLALTKIRAGATTYVIELQVVQAKDGNEPYQIVRCFGQHAGQPFAIGDPIRCEKVADIVFGHSQLARELIEKHGNIRTGQYYMGHSPFWREFLRIVFDEINEGVPAKDRTYLLG